MVKISQFVQGELGKLIKNNMRETKGKLFIGAKPSNLKIKLKRIWICGTETFVDYTNYDFS